MDDERPVRKLKVDLPELEFAFDQREPEFTYYLDLETGKVLLVTAENSSRLEALVAETGEDDPDLPSLIARQGLPDWEKEELLEVASVRAGEGEKLLRVPTAEPRQGFADMEDFVETVRDRNLRNRLEMALRGRGPFRAFRNALSGFPKERERWYTFENERLRARVLRWLEDEGIEALQE